MNELAVFGQVEQSFEQLSIFIVANGGTVELFARGEEITYIERPQEWKPLSTGVEFEVKITLPLNFLNSILRQEVIIEGVGSTPTESILKAIDNAKRGYFSPRAYVDRRW